MSAIGQTERETQNRVIALFHDELKYDYLGDWTDRPNNSNVEEKFLTAFLAKRGYSAAQISRALDRLRTEAGNPNRSLYENNRAVYSLLRYGVPVQAAAGENTDIEADESRKISPFDDMPLLELIVKTGIANAINGRLGGLKGNKDAIAESIENNVRKKIIKEHLSDPAF